jgi:hypothetical protein
MPNAGITWPKTGIFLPLPKGVPVKKFLRKKQESEGILRNPCVEAEGRSEDHRMRFKCQSSKN